MEERSIKVLENETFFNRISNTLTKLLIPTKLSLNGMLITLKRNAVIKNYETYKELKEDGDSKEASALNKYEESYTLYLEAIDKYIMDSVYKKVKNRTATAFEKNALSEYYNVVQLKDNEYNEYKARKQKFLLDLDYESLLDSGKEKVIKKYKNLYLEKNDELYKSILKTYSIKLADGIKAKYSNQLDVYKNIYLTLDDYAKSILPLKIELGYKDYSKIKSEYEELEKFDVGKLDEKDFLEKNMLLLAMSRVLFTHSLPLVAAEQCYKKLLTDARDLIVETKAQSKRNEVYETLIRIINNYNEKLLSTKVYWDNPSDRDAYKKFWSKYCSAKDQTHKEIEILRKELYDIRNENGLKIEQIRKFYKQKLVEYGDMKQVKNNVKSISQNKFKSNTKLKELIELERNNLRDGKAC